MYTIQILGKPRTYTVEVIASLLQDKITQDGRFRVSDWKIGQVEEKPTLFLKRIRLVTSKPYCGNHPGECQVNPFRGQEKKKVTCYLEWDDWVAFHTLVNRLLSSKRVRANIWTLPPDVKGKMWIRKDRLPRLHWDYNELPDRSGRIIRHWNTGTPDQFQGQKE
jgi:hypothetical protein